MKTKMQYAALVACALLIIPAAALADTGTGQQNQATSVQQSYLNAVLARATCQATFETGFISAAISDIPNIDQTAISSDSSKISTDLQTLTTDVNNKDKGQFKTDVKSFRTDSKTGMFDLRSAIKNAKPTSDERTKLKNDISNLRSTEKNCMFGAGQQFANIKVQAWGIAIQHLQNRTNALSKRGVDTTQLSQIIGQAQANLGNLAAALSSATNSTQLKAALQSYCQYNGCKSGTNFHFAAKSVLATEQAMLNAIKSNPNSGQYGSQIDQAQTDLTNAQNTLNTVGTDQYQGTQSKDVWNALHDTNSIIKQLWNELHEKSTSSSSSSSGPSSGSSSTSGSSSGNTASE